jgi:hypothetical protein
MKIYARQGDLVIRRADMSAENLEPATDYVVAGSHTAPHVIMGATRVRRDGSTLHVSVEVDTELRHAGRHKTIPLPTGSYTITTQRERNGDLDQDVRD